MSERSDLRLTEPMLFEIAEIVGRGNFRHVAAGLVGVTPNTLHTWVRRGKAHLADYHSGKKKDMTVQARLVVELERAEAEVHDKLIVDIVENGSPEMKMKYLKARYNKLYNNNPNAIDDATGEETRVSVADMLMDKLSNFLEVDE